MATQATRAEQNHVRMYTVSFGSDADTSLHQLMAQKTEGASYYAADHSHLTDIFVDIFRRLPPIITQCGPAGTQCPLGRGAMNERENGTRRTQ